MLMVDIVFVLLLITLGVIALRVGNSIPDGMDVLFIVGKNPSVTIGEDGKAWEANKNVEIFRSDYQNGEGYTTIVSQDGSKVVAPGMTSTYAFAMHNNGNVAVVYQTDLSFVLKEGETKVDSSSFPMKVRLKNGNGDYLIGDEETWVQVKDATLAYHPGLLGSTSYESFYLELYWAYDGESDELDTQLGNLSAEAGVSLTLKISSYAEEAPDPTAKGGTLIETEGAKEQGGTIRWLWLILLMLNAAILIFYIAWLLNKRLNKFSA